MVMLPVAGCKVGISTSTGKTNIIPTQTSSFGPVNQTRALMLSGLVVASLGLAHGPSHAPVLRIKQGPHGVAVAGAMGRKHKDASRGPCINDREAVDAGPTRVRDRARRRGCMLALEFCGQDNNSQPACGRMCVQMTRLAPYIFFSDI